jgi:hypothetical protein
MHVYVNNIYILGGTNSSPYWFQWMNTLLIPLKNHGYDLSKWDEPPSGEGWICFKCYFYDDFYRWFLMSYHDLSGSVLNWDLCCDVCADLWLGNHEEWCVQDDFPTWCVLTKGHSRDLWLMKRFYYDCNDVLWITESHQPYAFFFGCLVLLRIWGPQKGGYMWMYNQEFMQLWNAKLHKTIR